MSVNENKARILILYYSFSGQINGLANNMADGLRHTGAEVLLERLRPIKPLRFPVGSIPATFKMMLTSFLRFQVLTQDPPPQCFGDFDLIILAGPTWSYNPSGPVLSIIDRFGVKLFADQNIVPLISCRGYWRLHCWGLRRKLAACGAKVVNQIVFSHPCREPWRTIGVFLKIAGKAPERNRILGDHYKRFGHSHRQHAEAERLGSVLGMALKNGEDLTGLNLQTNIARPKYADCR